MEVRPLGFLHMEMRLFSGPFRPLILAFVSVSTLLAVCAPAKAAEQVGDIAVSGLFLEPNFLYNEPHQGQFRAGNSFLAVTWSRDSLLSATLKVGSRSLIGVPTRFTSTMTGTDSDVALIEGYAQADSLYGRFRAGLIPIPYGIEGGDAEERLHFPRSLFFQRKLVPLRDQGLSYHISFQGFFSDWAVHNGEGGADLDNEEWFTARWGWQGGHFFRAGFSGTSGRTNPKSTDPLGTSLVSIADAGIDVKRNSKVRIANAFFDWEVEPVSLEFEVSAGDSYQGTGNGDSDHRMRAFHLDLEYGKQSWGALTRYDVFDPDTETSGDRTDQYSVGVSWKSRYENSVLYLFLTKTIQENVSPNAHSVLLVWRMTPLANSFRSAL